MKNAYIKSELDITTVVKIITFYRKNENKMADIWKPSNSTLYDIFSGGTFYPT